MLFWRHTTKQKQIMHEGRLLKSELIESNGEMFYVERVAFKDWHVSLHNFYLISDRLCDGHTMWSKAGTMMISVVYPSVWKTIHLPWFVN